jgi:hypothetical protein
LLVNAGVRMAVQALAGARDPDFVRGVATGYVRTLDESLNQ